MGLLVGPIKNSFDISDTQYSLLAGFAFSLFYALMGLPLARIADRGSRRNLIVIGITAWSFMTALCGLAKGYWTLFFARMGVGVGEATLGPAAYSMIADYFPKNILARALSVYMIGVTLGSGQSSVLCLVANQDRNRKEKGNDDKGRDSEREPRQPAPHDGSTSLMPTP